MLDGVLLEDESDLFFHNCMPSLELSHKDACALPHVALPEKYCSIYTYQDLSHVFMISIVIMLIFYALIRKSTKNKNKGTNTEKIESDNNEGYQDKIQ